MSILAEIDRHPARNHPGGAAGMFLSERQRT